MAAPAWIEPFLGWLTRSPIRTTDLRRIEGNTKHLRDGVTVFSGTKQFQNNVEMLSQLIVRAETILREIVQISGTLQMLGNVTIDPRPGFGGTGNVTISTGQLQLDSGNLIVGGNTNLNGDVSVSGALLAPAIDTGQGPTECYGMNQDVRTIDPVIFSTVRQTTMGSRLQIDSTLTNAGDTFVIPSGKFIISIIAGAGQTTNLQLRNSVSQWVTLFSVTADTASFPTESDGSNVRVQKAAGVNAVTVRRFSLTF